MPLFYENIENSTLEKSFLCEEYEFRKRGSDFKHYPLCAENYDNKFHEVSQAVGSTGSRKDIQWYAIEFFCTFLPHLQFIQISKINSM